MGVNRRGGVVVRASTSQSVDNGSIPLSSHTDNFETAVTTSVLDTPNESVVKNPASLLVVSIKLRGLLAYIAGWRQLTAETARKHDIINGAMITSIKSSRSINTNGVICFV